MKLPDDDAKCFFEDEGRQPHAIHALGRVASRDESIAEELMNGDSLTVRIVRMPDGSFEIFRV